jgi:hypothetical protein
MGRFRAAAVAAVLVFSGVVLSGGSASAKPPWAEDLALISSGIARAQAAGRIDAATAGDYRGVTTAAAATMPKLRSSRYRNLAAVVHEVAGFWKGYDRPRGRTLFAMLDFNTRWFASHWDRKSGTDVVDYTDGTWYRAFPGIGFQFHPLENFGKLNGFVAQKNDARAAQLAQSLLDRSVVRGGGLAWEYYFRFGSGRPPWVSGMAQAVAAQALARAGTRLGDPQLTAASQRVFKTVPSLTHNVTTGPWIRLYSFSGLAVLNAQLQTIVSLQDYATQTGDAAAASLASRLQSSTEALLPRFDTGYWSLYSVDGDEAPLDYHKYVVRLLTMLAKRTGSATFAAYQQKFGDDLREPPVLKEGSGSGPIYPWPTDGYKDTATYRVWVSKRSTVRFVVDNAPKPFVVSRGWHWLSWSPGKVAPGTYQPSLRAVDVVGNKADFDLAPVEVRRDTSPPELSASLAGRRLRWSGKDDASPWLTLRVVVRSPAGVKAITLRHAPFRGSATLPLTRGSRALLFAADSSGNTALVVLR